jgi:hypothetical protein
MESVLMSSSRSDSQRTSRSPHVAHWISSLDTKQYSHWLYLGQMSASGRKTTVSESPTTAATPQTVTTSLQQFGLAEDRMRSALATGARISPADLDAPGWRRPAPGPWGRPLRSAAGLNGPAVGVPAWPARPKPVTINRDRATRPTAPSRASWPRAPSTTASSCGAAVQADRLGDEILRQLAQLGGVHLGNYLIAAGMADP